MFEIPNTFKDENESYITVPALKRFAKEKGNFRTNTDRPELMRDIERFANQSKENKEIVLNWLDSVLREGIKEIQIKFFDLDMAQVELYKNNDYVEGLLKTLIFDTKNEHLCNKYEKDLKLYRYDISGSLSNKVIKLSLGKLINTYDKKKGKQAIIYPIIVDIYLDKCIIVGRAKSKSGMYEYMVDFDPLKGTTTTADKELRRAIRLVADLLQLKSKSALESSDNFRGKLYKMLEKYTDTPKEILDLMENKKEEVNSIKEIIIHKICNLTPAYELDVVSDVNNMIEKYFSISYPDKKIFTQDRDAYPLKIIATDEEDSKVEQTAALEEPLQSKAIFFDNKKMLQKSKLCDGVYFRFSRIDSAYCSKEFNVKINVKNDQCTIKFMEYTMEEDIVHVLFSFINS